MQFYALDGNDPILASSAQKQKDYCCPECRSTVRVRSGPHRQIHFYHTKTQRLCRQHKKTLTHLHIQWLLHSLLSPEEVFLEHRFPAIGRIADVFWKGASIVFEVQCSSISVKEAEERCQDYKSLGLTPVWILYDRRYNRTFCSAAELFLREGPCYFTNGKGFFYDQAEVIRRARRVFRGPPLKVHLDRPKPLPHFHFLGDRYHRFGLQRLQELNNNFAAHRPPFSLVRFVKRIYRSFFHMLLENVK